MVAGVVGAQKQREFVGGVQAGGGIAADLACRDGVSLPFPVVDGSDGGIVAAAYEIVDVVYGIVALRVCPGAFVPRAVASDAEYGFVFAPP